MARVRVCGVCWKPVAECLCDEDPRAPAEPQDGSEDET
jgi:DTW domain-containing protein YfiP